MNWSNILLSISSTLLTLLVILLTPIYKNYVAKIIENKFSKQLELHKHNLNLLTENIKFDIQRKTYDFNLYTSKRHEIYKDLYKNILIAHGRVVSLMGVRNVVDIKQLNLEGLLEYSKQLDFPNSISNELTEKWGLDEDICKRYFQSILRNKEFSDAEYSINNLNNLHLESKLFLSERVDFLTDSLVRNIKLLLHRYNFSEKYAYVPNYTNGGAKPEEIENNLKLEIDKICDFMKQELKKGDYESS